MILACNFRANFLFCIFLLGHNPRKWYPNDGGWELHVASTISEWIVAVCFCLYILTFYSEFSEISFSHPQVRKLDLYN